MESREAYLGGVRSLVVKLGTQLLSDRERRLDTAYIAEMARQIALLRQRGLAVTVVSSGAVGAGLRELDLSRRPSDLARLQAVAAVGQRRLMDAWAAAFSPHKMPVAQILLTRDDIDKRARFLNLRNTISEIHALGAIPIINENDTVSTDELIKISFGDNDILAAAVTQALRADLLVLLSVVDGVLDEGGKPMRLIGSIEEARSMVRREKSALGKGGMNSKIEAARVVTGSGESMVVADGRMNDILLQVLAGAEVGTLFVPSARRRRDSWRRWMISARPVGAVVVDAGAEKALCHNGKSLLPAGVVKVEGDFGKGDLIAVRLSDGKSIARGLTNYSAQSVRQIRGKKSAEVRAMLGEAAYEEVIHRNNLLVD